MKRQFFYCALASVLSMAMLAGLVGCIQQARAKDRKDTVVPPKVPHMSTPDALSQADEARYTAQVPMLTANLGAPETDSVFYPKDAFQQMIATLGKLPKVALLDICPVANPATKKLTVIYIPEDSDCVPLGYYYLPENATSYPQAGDALTIDQYHDWVDSYENTAGQWLKSFLDATDPDNYVDGNTLTSMHNTLHASHWYHDLVELSAEVDYQIQIGNKISGVEAFFAMKPPNSPGAEYGPSNRLYVILEFAVDDAAGKHQKFNISTQGRQIQRSDPPSKDACYVTAPKLKRDKHQKIAPAKGPKKPRGGMNNGQLCPPTCIP